MRPFAWSIVQKICGHILMIEPVEIHVTCLFLMAQIKYAYKNVLHTTNKKEIVLNSVMD